MKVYAGKKPGKGKYICSRCKNEILITDNETVLTNCPECGAKKFFIKLNFELSPQGLKERLEESIGLLEMSCFMFDALAIKSFALVIAIQLRVLLCDTWNGEDISLLPKLMTELKLSPVTNDYLYPEPNSKNDKLINPSNLFNKSGEPINLEQWLNQEVIFGNWGRPVTLRNLIKFYANKHGGAHVVDSLTESEMVSVMMADQYLLNIAYYLISFLGFNFAEDVKAKIIDKIHTWIHRFS